jgi:hypothetical protein
MTPTDQMGHQMATTDVSNDVGMTRRNVADSDVSEVAIDKNTKTKASDFPQQSCPGSSAPKIVPKTFPKPFPRFLFESSTSRFKKT